MSINFNVTTEHYILEDSKLHICCHENPKSHNNTLTANKILGHTEVSVCYKSSSSNKTTEIMAVLISSRVSAVTLGHGCKTPILLLV
jgi:hypothetical protein